MSPVGDLNPPTKFIIGAGVTGMSAIVSGSSTTNALYAITVPVPAIGWRGSIGIPNPGGTGNIFATKGGALVVSVTVTGCG